MIPRGRATAATSEYPFSVGRQVASIGSASLHPSAVRRATRVDPGMGTSNQPEYYVKTELTRVPGKVARMSAERVADDVPQLVGGQAKPKDADNPHGGEPNKTVPAKGDGPAKPGTPAAPASPKPAGSKPNPTEGNK